MGIPEPSLPPPWRASLCQSNPGPPCDNLTEGRKPSNMYFRKRVGGQTRQGSPGDGHCQQWLQGGAFSESPSDLQMDLQTGRPVPHTPPAPSPCHCSGLESSAPSRPLRSARLQVPTQDLPYPLVFVPTMEQVAELASSGDTPHPVPVPGFMPYSPR